MPSLADMPRPFPTENVASYRRQPGQFYGAISSDNEGTALRESTRVVTPREETSLMGGVTPWFGVHSLSESYSSLLSVQGGLHGTSELRNQIEQLDARTQSQFEVLSSKVDRLAGALQAFCSQQSTSLGSVQSLPTSEAEFAKIDPETSDTIADLFDQVADGFFAPEWVLNAARSSLSHTESTVRAAAGRALAVLEPAAAKPLLVAAIERESNAFTASILRGALRAIEV